MHWGKAGQLVILASTVLGCTVSFRAEAKNPKVPFSGSGSALAHAHASYEHIHAHPELSGKEEQTGKYLASRLRELGFEVQERVGGEGVIGVLKNGPGKTFALRTEMDALPVLEQTGLPFASKVQSAPAKGGEMGPVMHACGHDMHMATWLGVAEVLSAHKSEWQGTLVLLAQPAEETLMGARALLDAGLLKRIPRPDLVFAVHGHDEMPVGQIGYVSGPFTASADSINLTVVGRGGHGAYPQAAIDPVVLASKIVLSLQLIVSRERSPQEPVVITVGSIHGGTKHNVIPDRVELKLTVRTYSAESRKRVNQAILRIAQAEAKAADAPAPVLEWVEGTNVSINDPAWTRHLVSLIEQQNAPGTVVQLKPEMGSEDFSEYGAAGIPTVMLMVGASDPKAFERFKAGGEPPPSLHSARYRPQPGTLEKALELELLAAWAVLGKGAPEAPQVPR